MTRILVDPRIAFGRPYVEGSGVMTATLFSRWKAGESMGTLSADYGLTLGAIAHALDFEEEWCRRRGRYDAPYAERKIRQHVNAVHRRGGALEEMRAVPGDWPRVVWPREGSA